MHTLEELKLTEIILKGYGHLKKKKISSDFDKDVMI